MKSAAGEASPEGFPSMILLTASAAAHNAMSGIRIVSLPSGPAHTADAPPHAGHARCNLPIFPKVYQGAGPAVNRPGVRRGTKPGVLTGGERRGPSRPAPNNPVFLGFVRTCVRGAYGLLNGMDAIRRCEAPGHKAEIPHPNAKRQFEGD